MVIKLTGTNCSVAKISRPRLTACIPFVAAQMIYFDNISMTNVQIWINTHIKKKIHRSLSIINIINLVDFRQHVSLVNIGNNKFYLSINVYNICELRFRSFESF